jgi:hypothetical protein
MGSTAQSAQLTPSTKIEGVTWGSPLPMTQVTSSGVYFNIGDASKYIVFVVNGSSEAGAVFVEPGARWAGSVGRAPSTTITAYTTATAPIAVALPRGASSISTAFVLSTQSCFSVLGPFDGVQVKSSGATVFIGNGSTLAVIAAAVYAWGSTN